MGGRSRELPREVCRPALGEIRCRGAEKQFPYVRQKSAEAIVVVLTKR